MRDDEIDMPRRHDPPWRSRHAHRNLPPDVAEMLHMARLGHGWTKSEAERRTGISRRMITLLERGERYPSQTLAEDLIDGYRLGELNADRLRGIALPNVGRDSPYRRRRAQATVPTGPGN